MRPFTMLFATAVTVSLYGGLGLGQTSTTVPADSNSEAFFDKDRGAPTKCYVVTRDDIRYADHAGIDPETGRECRPVTPEVVERLRAYKWGSRPQRVEKPDPTFFSLRTGEPIIWYRKTEDGNFELFDLMGFDPETGVELLPITRDVVTLWRAQDGARRQQEARRVPQPINPEKYEPFDPLSGKPRVWLSLDASGEYRFYDNSGFDPRTGEPLMIISREALETWRELNSKQDGTEVLCDHSRPA